MAVKCGECGAEFDDGPVFCDRCGGRIVAGVPDRYEDDRPFYAFQWMGQTYLLTFAGWALRWLVFPMFVSIGIMIVASSAGRDGLPLFAATFLIASLYFLTWVVLIGLYRRRGRPADFGGSGPPSRP